MRQEAAWRVQMLLVIWSLLSLGTGFPTRHKTVGHKVSWLPHMADASLKQQVRRKKKKKITHAADKTDFPRQCRGAKCPFASWFCWIYR